MHHTTTGSLSRAALLITLATALLSACATTPPPAPAPPTAQTGKTPAPAAQPCGGPSQPTCEVYGLNALTLGAWHDPERAMAAFTQGCTASTPDRAACARLSWSRLIFVSDENSNASMIALEQQCSQGFALACTLQADLLRMLLPPAQITLARPRYTRGCELSPGGEACEGAQILDLEEARRGKGLGEAALKALEARGRAACARGVMQGCELAARAHLELPGFLNAARRESALALLRKACEARQLSACGLEARVIISASPHKREVHLAASTPARQGCLGRLGDLEACAWLQTSTLLGHGADKAQRLKLAARGEKMCRDGFPAWCALAAVAYLLEDDKRFAPLASTSCLQHKLLCGMFSGKVMVDLAERDHTPTARRELGARALAFARRGCEGPHPEQNTCMYLLAPAIKPDLGLPAIDGPDALARLDRACALGSGEACEAQGAILGDLDLPGVQQDRARAMALIHKACALGQASSCGSLQKDCAEGNKLACKKSAE